jgi:signal transduction histidine kinase
MILARRYSWMLLAIAVSVWIAIGVMLMALTTPTHNTGTPVFLWLALLGAFGAALLISILLGRRSPNGQMLLIAVEIAALTAMAALPDRGDPGPLMAPVALQVALLFGTRPALYSVVLQSLLIWAARWQYLPDMMSWLYWGLNVAAEVIAVGAVHLLRFEAETSQTLTRVNAELRITQALLAERAAAAERVRISRELHDAWGHDLTALSLQLEYACHVAPDVGVPSVLEARDLTKSLLAKVRDVVGTLRRYEGHDIKPMLEALAASVPQLDVHLEISEGLATHSAEVAQTLMRSAQEIITNTLRHAHARNLWLSLHADVEGLRLDSRDDGKGTDQFKIGFGLNGLRERFEQQGGRIVFESASGEGFRVVGWLPGATPRL